MTDNISNLFQQHKSKLLIFISSKVKHPQDAEDILAQVFLKLLKQKQSIENPVAWIYQVTKNVIIDYYRSYRPNDALPEDIIAADNTPDHFQQFSECIKPMVQALDENYRQVIFQADLQGIKQKQVAQSLGLSLSAVKSRILRGRQQLQHLIVQCCPPQLGKQGEVIDFNATENSCKKC